MVLRLSEVLGRTWAREERPENSLGVIDCLVRCLRNSCRLVIGVSHISVKALADVFWNSAVKCCPVRYVWLPVNRLGRKRKGTREPFPHWTESPLKTAPTRLDVAR